MQHPHHLEGNTAVAYTLSTATFAPPILIKAGNAPLRSTENKQEANIDQDAETFTLLYDTLPYTVSAGGDAAMVALNGWTAHPYLP